MSPLSKTNSESVLKESIAGGRLLRCDSGLWRWSTWGTSSHPLCLQSLLPKGERLTDLEMCRSIGSKTIYIRCSSTRGSGSQWRSYSWGGWVSFLHLATKKQKQQNKRQPITEIPLMLKGGAEAADISAGFHLHWGGRLAQVETFSWFLNFLKKLFQLINFLFIRFMNFSEETQENFSAICQ